MGSAVVPCSMLIILWVLLQRAGCQALVCKGPTTCAWSGVQLDLLRSQPEPHVLLSGLQTDDPRAVTILGAMFQHRAMR